MTNKIDGNSVSMAVVSKEESLKKIANDKIEKVIKKSIEEVQALKAQQFVITRLQMGTIITRVQHNKAELIGAVARISLEQPEADWQREFREEIAESVSGFSKFVLDAKSLRLDIGVFYITDKSEMRGCCTHRFLQNLTRKDVKMIRDRVNDIPVKEENRFHAATIQTLLEEINQSCIRLLENNKKGKENTKPEVSQKKAASEECKGQ